MTLALAAPTACGPSALTRMHVERAVSPWLDHLSRADLVSGSLGRMVAAGVRGVSADHTGLTATDVQTACAVLQPVHEMSQGTDGFVSLQVAPATLATISRLYQRIDRPNFLVSIPATGAGVLALQATVSTGCSTNATSIFSLARYSAVIEAYQTGLEAFVARGGDPATVHGLASFSLGGVDTEVDGRLGRLEGARARELRGRAAVSQAMLACRLFEERFCTERWARLARRGAVTQRLAWTCTGTTHGPDRALGYLDALSVSYTVQVHSASTLTALNLRGLGDPAPGIDPLAAAGVLSGLTAVGIDLDDVAELLERRGSARAQEALTGTLDGLSERSEQR